MAQTEIIQAKGGLLATEEVMGMIVGVGIDIIEIQRVKEALARPGFAERVFTAAERHYCDDRGVQRFASYAARFAGKEAVMKAFGTGLAKGSWQDIEILPDGAGRPQVALSGHFAALANGLQADRIHLSLSHARDYAAAQAVLEGRSGR